MGDPVLGVYCPKCKGHSIVYNGNYYCELCDWAMSDRKSKFNIRVITTYLKQRRQEALDRLDQKEVDRMDSYLKDYGEEA